MNFPPLTPSEQAAVNYLRAQQVRLAHEEPRTDSGRQQLIYALSELQHAISQIERREMES